MEPIHTDIAVLGGGAAGLAAAIHAARTSKCGITILERNPRLGKKLINTGNGRCNLSHSPANISSFHGERALVQKVFSETMGEDEFFLSLGLKLRQDGDGNIYPYSNTAASVLDALRLETVNLNINTITEYNAISLEPLLEGFRITPDDEGKPIVNARRIILTPGGKAAPGTGSDGSCFSLIKKLGIIVQKPLPALCPIKTSNKAIRAMKGLRINACCSAMLSRPESDSPKLLRTETGEIQFGEDKLSGICIFNLSRLASIHGEALTISIDLAPEIPLDELSKFITQTAKIRTKSPIEDLLSGLLPKRCGVTLTKLITELPMNAPIGSLTLNELESLSIIIKDWRFPVLYSEPWLNSQVTAGGVLASQLSDTLSAKKYKHLYFAGEVINVDADCGGYNLMWCWRSGELAGRAAAKSL